MANEPINCSTPSPTSPDASTAASAPDGGSHANRDQSAFDQENLGLEKGLGRRQIQMIAIGSAIGTGLFLGAGEGLSKAGPSLFLVYALCGFFGYLILRALGELVVYRPTSGSFVSYTREFFGEKVAYVAGWLYWLNWAVTAIADATALAIYINWFGQYSSFIANIPQWVSALIVVVSVLSMNIVSVKVFGELEFWFALIKVAALVIFLIVGICFIIFGTPTGSPTGLHLISEHGGLVPHGVLPALIMVQGVVFAYAGIELIGTASGETKDPKREVPRAINTVIARIAIFYAGSVLLLCLLLPYTKYSADESPFVTFFSSIGVSGIGPIMQLVVITAALSSLNAGIYSTGRIVHSLAMAGSAPKYCRKITRHGVPIGGMILTAMVAFLGVGLNAIVPEDAFTIVLNLAALGTMAGWAAIVAAHIRFVSLARRGAVQRPHYRAPLAPWTNWLTIGFLLLVVGLMAWDYPIGTYTLASTLVLIPILMIGWFAVRGRVKRIAQENAERGVRI